MPDIARDMLMFHAAIDAVIQDFPAVPDAATIELRIELIKEETQELLKALHGDDLVEIADGAVDSIVVILGTLISYGIDFNPLWDEVLRTNMAKASGPVREDGKRLKPEGWQPPQINELLSRQTPLRGLGFQ